MKVNFNLFFVFPRLYSHVVSTINLIFFCWNHAFVVWFMVIKSLLFNLRLYFEILGVNFSLTILHCMADFANFS